MRKDILERALKHGYMFLERDATVKSIAKKTGWSANTVFHDLKTRLKEVNPYLHQKVQDKLEENKTIGRLKGAYKSQEKFIKRREKKNNV